MKNIFNKTNSPYLASGALAIGTLLISGIFAVAPYIGFLAPFAALSLGLPFVIGGAIFSVAVIALSYKAIGKNGDIRKQNTLLHEEAKKNAELTLELKEKDARLAKNDTKLFDKQEQLPKEEVKLDHLDLAVSSSKQGKQANSLDYLNIDNVSKQFDLSSIDAAKKHLMSLVEKDINEDILFDAEPGEEKSTKNPSPVNQPTQNGQSWGAWSLDKAKTAARLVVGAAMLAATVAPVLVGTLFEESSASPAGDRFGSINGTYSRY